MAGRRKTELFDRGFSSIEELKRRSLAETGFPAPNSPVFHRILQAAE